MQLSETGKRKVEEVGGKAKSLGKLKQDDFQVPAGNVIPSSTFQKFLENNSINTSLQLSEKDNSEIKKRSEDIRQQIISGDVSEDMREDIVSELRFEKVAIRSSSVEEDGSVTSFAGLHESYLGVENKSDILKCVKKVWASAYTERALMYRKRRDMDMPEGIAVIIQEMVDADISGTAFTVNPDSGESEIIIESTYGLGETVVSGSITPDRVILDKDALEIKSKEQGRIDTKMVAQEGEVKEKEVSKSGFSLSEEEAKKVSRKAKDIEELFGKPQDVEWSLSNGELWILQSRPITTV